MNVFCAGRKNPVMSNAVITGATQGIGKAVAEKFLQEGFNVAICARNNTQLQAVKVQWQAQFPQASIIAVPADLSKKEAVKSFAEKVLKTFESIDVLVNNAGLFFPGKLAEEPAGQLEQLIETNLYSAYHLTRALLPEMKLCKAGHIFNLCSVASLRAYENGGAYSISKYALYGFSENLRFELMDYNIKVTSVIPGATWSNSWAMSGLPEERFMQPADIATMIWAAYQLSPQANLDSFVMRPLKGDI